MRRILLCLVLLIGTLVIPATAFAQDECSGPLDLDSDFLTASKDAMAAVSSYATVAGVSFSLENGPGLPAELGASMDVDGVFALDPEISERFLELQNMDAEEAAANMQESMEEMMTLVVDLYQTIDFDMEMILGVSTDLGNLIAANGGLESFPSELSLPARMTEGFMYFNVDDIAANFAAPADFEGWFGIDYGTLMADTIETAMAEMEEGGEVDASAASMAASMGGMMAVQTALKQYVSIEAVGTDEVDGVEVCEVQSVYDLAGFLADPAFVDMMVSQMKMQMEMQAEMGGGEMPMTEADVDMIAQMLPMLAPMLLSGLELNSSTWIGVEDGLVYASEGELVWDMSSLASMASAMAAQSGEAAPLDADNPPFLSISFAQENSDFDAEFEVEVPDPVTIIPLEALQADMQ